MSKKSAIHVVSDDAGGFFVLFIDQKAYAQLEDGKNFETIKTTAFRALRHEGQTITNLVIELVDGKPSVVRAVEE